MLGLVVGRLSRCTSFPWMRSVVGPLLRRLCHPACQSGRPEEIDAAGPYRVPAAGGVSSAKDRPRELLGRGIIRGLILQVGPRREDVVGLFPLFPNGVPL